MLGFIMTFSYVYIMYSNIFHLVSLSFLPSTPDNSHPFPQVSLSLSCRFFEGRNPLSFIRVVYRSVGRHFISDSPLKKMSLPTPPIINCL